MPAVADAPPAAPVSQPAQAAQTTVSALAAVPPPSAPLPPPKPGSARERMSKALHERFGGETPTPTPAPKPGAKESPATAVPPAAKPDESHPEGGAPATTDAPPSLDPKTGEVPPATPTSESGKKVSPWKLVDQFKDRATKAEARALELEKQVIPEAKRKEVETEVTNLRQQVKTMTEELRFHNAEKYDPDIKQAEEAYQGAWKRAMGELSEITVTDPATQQPRALTAQDLMELVQLPLGKAREIADQVFGTFADDVMDHRKEIRRLLQEKSDKLESLKKSGSERERQRQEQYQQQLGQVQKFVKDTYEQAVTEALSDEKLGQYFKPRDGDDEWNTRLEKGFKFVDGAYGQNAMDPKLTTEQRADVIRRHAAVRNRAASWGALRYQTETLNARIAALEKELKEYKSATPSAGGRSPTTEKPKLSGMAGLRASLQAIARPG